MNAFLFVALPYMAIVLAVLGGIYRFHKGRYSYSSLSSQLLEHRRLFWGSVPWHYGITLILLAHLFAGLFPRAAAYILGGPIRLLVLEFTGMSLAIFALFGLVVLIIRRLPSNSLARAVTSRMDGVLLIFLLLQVATGLSIALFDRWGSLWYLRTAVPWFWSLVELRPDMNTVAFLPAFVKFHFVPWIRRHSSVSFHPASTPGDVSNLVLVASISSRHLAPAPKRRKELSGVVEHGRKDP